MMLTCLIASLGAHCWPHRLRWTGKLQRESGANYFELRRLREQLFWLTPSTLEHAPATCCPSRSAGVYRILSMSHTSGTHMIMAAPGALQLRCPPPSVGPKA